MRRFLAIVFTQHLANGELSRLGLVVEAVYLAGAILCVRSAVVAQRHERGDTHDRSAWWVLAALLAILGLNKWLDAQTLLIRFGRAAAQAQGWSQYDRTVQALCVVLFTILASAGIILCLVKWRWFLRERPLVCIGMVLLFLFLILRDASINHVDERLHLNLHDDSWGWILELLATACFAWSAASRKPR